MLRLGSGDLTLSDEPFKSRGFSPTDGRKEVIGI